MSGVVCWWCGERGPGRRLVELPKSRQQRDPVGNVVVEAWLCPAGQELAAALRERER